MISHQLALAIIPHEYDNMVGRRIHQMKQKALAEAAKPLVDYFFESSKDFLEDEGIENYKAYVCHDPGCKDKSQDLYSMAVAIEDLGAEFCANYVGLKLERQSATEIRISFAKRTDRAPTVSSFNKD